MLARPEDGVFILYLLLHAFLLARSWLCARKHADKAGFLALVSGGGCLPWLWLRTCGSLAGRQRSCWAPGHTTSARPMVPILTVVCKIVSQLQGTRCDNCGPVHVWGGESCWGKSAAVRGDKAEGDSFAKLPRGDPCSAQATHCACCLSLSLTHTCACGAWWGGYRHP